MDENWLAATMEMITSYRRMIDGAVVQLSDVELNTSPGPGINCVSIILRHLGGNLRSRWTDFLTTDGEKPDRDRDSEFVAWPGDRASLLAYFDTGWQTMVHAVSTLSVEDLRRTVRIRGEAHTVPQAIMRSITHTAYHVGQIMLIARTMHQGEWKWLTIALGNSASFNKETWGTARSRAVMGDNAHGKN